MIAELVLRHEHQHNETMLQTLQLARLDGYTLGEGSSLAAPEESKVVATENRRMFSGLEMVEIPAASAPWARRPAASPTTTSARVTAPMCAPI